MELVSINVGKQRAIEHAKASGVTGIYKTPQTEGVAIGLYGVDGDFIADTDNHGGVDQAVYVFGTPDYAWWSQKLGQELAPGTFGDNMTISDLVSADLLIGDRLQVGAVVLEVTSPRIPCVTINVRMGDPQFVKKFRYAEKPGVYCRVITPGTVYAGDAVTLIPYTGEAVTILEGFRKTYERGWTEPEIRRYLSVPIAIRWRTFFEDELAGLS